MDPETGESIVLEEEIDENYEPTEEGKYFPIALLP